MEHSPDLKPLSSWFRDAGGELDSSVLSFAYFPADGGRGAIALQNIDSGHMLFSLPRSLTLSTRTSSLPALLGETWDRYELGRGWAGLILCCLWEESRGSASKWSGYLHTLPTQFDTPMFWSENEIAELAGTAVVDKIGKAQAEEDYQMKVVPVVKAHPEVFGTNDVERYFSASAYHRAGSRILSRSFTVQKWRGPLEEVPITADQDTHDMPDPDSSQGSIDNTGMEVDKDAAQVALAAEVQQDTPGDDSDEENEDDPSDVALVPIADMLNARNGAGNAKLFYEANVLKMITTKRITRGEQIWNTYGDPPNSDLLRRYGHVDILSLDTLNPADIAELPADKLVNALPESARAGAMDRVEFWLDEGGDDVFILETDDALPDTLLSFVRLLNLTTPEYTKAREKSKLPKGKSLDVTGAFIACTALRARLSEYTSTLEVDEALLGSDNFNSLPRRQQHAIVVRVGEKRILHTALRYAEAIAQPSRGSGEAKTGGKAKKRKTPNDDSGPSSQSSKKAKS